MGRQLRQQRELEVVVQDLLICDAGGWSEQAVLTSGSGAW